MVKLNWFEKFSVLAAIMAWLVLPAVGFSQEQDAEGTSRQIESAIRRSLSLLEKTSAQTAGDRACFTCHGQALPVMALAQAREQGFEIDLENLQRQISHTHEYLEEGLANYREGKGQGGQVDTAGYAALTLKAGDWPADAVTTAVAEYLLQYQSNQDHWSSSSNRPPSEASDFSATYVALISLNQFGTPEQQTRIVQRKSQVKQWLLSAAARDTEDEVFRLLSMQYADIAPNLISDKATELIAKQRDDGGWSQNSEMASDAYATGTVLVALNRSSHLAVDDPIYQRGIRFLINTQNEDGSWHVVSHSKPFQEYFESGFPHGVDQFISATATGWAVLALLSATAKADQTDPNRLSPK